VKAKCSLGFNENTGGLLRRRCCAQFRKKCSPQQCLAMYPRIRAESSKRLRALFRRKSEELLLTKWQVTRH